MEKKAGYVEGTVSVVINTALFAMKLWAGIVTGSLALTADAWHTLSDSLSSLIVIIATKISARQADHEHPFGHGRWEQIAALFISALLATLGYEFFTGAIARLTRHEPTHFGALAITVTVVSILVKEAMAQYAFYLARRADSATIKADGWHHRSDALSSIVVLIGILAAGSYWWLDGALGMFVALMLFYAAYKITRETANKLLGEIPTDELITRITAAIKNLYPGDLQLHHFHLHNYVSHQELTFHIRIDGNLSIAEGHRIASGIENVIADQFGIIATVHTEPLAPSGAVSMEHSEMHSWRH